MFTKKEVSTQVGTVKLTKKDFFTQSGLIVKLGIPILLGQLAQMSMAFVDTVMAGSAGNMQMALGIASGADQVAAVGIGSAFWVPLLLFGQGMVSCIGPLVAQGLGAGHNKSLNHFWRQGFWLALCVSFFLLILFSISSHFILNSQSIEPKLALITSRYINYIMWGMPAFLLFFVCRFFLEGRGHTRPAMIAGFIGLACNIPLNYIFVFGRFGMPALGGAGCGLASAVVCWVMLGVMLYFLRSYSPKTIGIVKPNFNLIKRMSRIGFPGALAMLLEVSSFALIALFIAPLGSVTVAGHQAAMNMSSLAFMFPLSLGIATSIRVGTCLGSQSHDEAKLVRKTSFIMSVILGSCLFIFFISLRELLPHMYSIGAAGIALASYILIFTALYQIPDSIQIVTMSALRGYNDTKALFVISIISYWAISIPIGYILCFTDLIVPRIGVVGFWVGLIMGLMVASISLMLRICYLEKMTPEQINAKISR